MANAVRRLEHAHGIAWFVELHRGVRGVVDDEAGRPAESRNIVRQALERPLGKRVRGCTRRHGSERRSSYKADYGNATPEQVAKAGPQLPTCERLAWLATAGTPTISPFFEQGIASSISSSSTFCNASMKALTVLRSRMTLEAIRLAEP